MPFARQYLYIYIYIYSPNLLKTRPFKILTFLSEFQMVFDKMVAFCPDFKSHSKYRPFETQPILDHSKSRQVRISDPTVCLLPLEVEVFPLTLTPSPALSLS